MTKPAHLKTGELGEDIACKYLLSKGFTIIERNYRKKWGEIDIVSQKFGKTYFIEVKASLGGINPEEHLTVNKINKLFRVFESYAMEQGTSLHDPNYDWQFDAIVVRLNSIEKEARIKYIDNIVLG